MPSPKQLFDAGTAMKRAMTSRATGGVWDAFDSYAELRATLMAEPSLRAKLPLAVRQCHDEGDFWTFIKSKFAHYQERREYLREEFVPLLAMLEEGALPPVHEGTVVAESWDAVQALWSKALERKESDPDGAITAARSLLESVCKHILDEAGVEYDDRAELPTLYGLTSKTMKMAPSQHTEEVFKQILGGCHSVVQGLGSLRSRIGDAHGQGKGKQVKPAPRHAELAVNLAGAMASYLIQTWKDRQAQG